MERRGEERREEEIGWDGMDRYILHYAVVKRISIRVSVHTQEVGTYVPTYVGAGGAGGAFLQQDMPFSITYGDLVTWTLVESRQSILNLEEVVSGLIVILSLDARRSLGQEHLDR